MLLRVSKFKKNFLEYYEIVRNEWKNNKQDYIPGIYGMELKNLHSKSLEYAISSIW